MAKRGRKSASTIWAAFEAAENEIHELEARLAKARKSAGSLLASINARMSRLASNLSGGQSSTRGTAVGNFRGTGKRGRKGKVAESIVAALKSSKKPLSADEIFKATGSKSKPSVSQTLMKMVHSGKVQRHNAEGKPIAKNDKSQRAKGYTLA